MRAENSRNPPVVKSPGLLDFNRHEPFRRCRPAFYRDYGFYTPIVVLFFCFIYLFFQIIIVKGRGKTFQIKVLI